MNQSPENPQSWCWLDGELLASSEARIGILDRGFLYGDSIFETFRTIDGQAIFVEDHLARFRQGADRMDLNLDYDDNSLLEIIYQVISRHPQGEDVVLRITLTRGDRIGGEIGIDSCQSRLVVLSTALDRQVIENRAGITVVVVNQNKIPPTCLDPNVKSGNYLGSILARNEAQCSGADDGILLSPEGFVTEATTANLFWIVDGEVFTCSEDLVLAGITRAKVLDILQQEQIRCHQGHYPVDHLMAADAAFLTSSIQGLTPISCLQQRLLGGGDGDVLMRRVERLYQQRIDFEISRSTR